MRRLLLLAAGCACILPGLSCSRTAAGAAAAAVTSVAKPPLGFRSVVVLWPKGAPGALGNGERDVPKLYVYPAAGEGVHPAVIVLPGGGYTHLATEKEGGTEARWLNEHGVTAFVLVYRLGPRYLFPAPMVDGARAVRYVRSHAAQLNIASNKIGLWGFSAGGHLAGYLATVHDAGRRDAGDPIDRVSDRPDFAILSYGRFTLDPSIPRRTSFEGLIGRHPSPATIAQVDVVQHVTHDTPPCFIYATTADQTVNSLNATALYDALKRAGVPAELHIFERGPHGTGMAQGLKRLPELAIYPMLIENWMQVHGWMTGAADSRPRLTPASTQKGQPSL